MKADLLKEMSKGTLINDMCQLHYIEPSSVDKLYFAAAYIANEMVNAVKSFDIPVSSDPAKSIISKIEDRNGLRGLFSAIQDPNKTPKIIEENGEIRGEQIIRDTLIMVESQKLTI
tara:strand:- start:257 stop:604 length:348 start_codon:yes stop_codon:yes gene_type:complete